MLQDVVMELLLAVAAHAALLRSLLTVTPSSDLHHITKRLIVFPADRVASQKPPPRGLLGSTKYIIRIAEVLLQQILPTGALHLQNIIIINHFCTAPY